MSSIMPAVRFHKGDKKKEIELFLCFLRHPRFPAHRAFILQALPRLQEFIPHAPNEKTAVQRFITWFYKEYSRAIAYSIAESKKRLEEQTHKALKALGTAPS